MKVIMKACLVSCYLLIVFRSGLNESQAIPLLLGVSAFQIARLKYIRGNWFWAVECVCVSMTVLFSPQSVWLCPLTSSDTPRSRMALLNLMPVCMVIFASGQNDILQIMIISSIAVCAAYGWQSAAMAADKDTMMSMLDDERRMRRDLQTAREQLLRSSEEISRSAELKERNRIAREIHDQAGHRIAAVLLSLRAASKIRLKDPEKAVLMESQAAENLAEALTQLRETVHSIRPHSKPGKAYFQSLADQYCDVPEKFLTVTGDTDLIPDHYGEILTMNLREALNNIQKYAGATRVEIQLDIHPSYIRLLIRDNGSGEPKIVTGLGLSGMLERARSVGGSCSWHSENGFCVVTVLPLRKDDLHESVNC